MDASTKTKFLSSIKEKGDSGVPKKPADEVAGEPLPEDTEGDTCYGLAERMCKAMGCEDESKHSEVASVLMDLKDHFKKE